MVMVYKNRVYAFVESNDKAKEKAHKWGSWNTWSERCPPTRQSGFRCPLKSQQHKGYNKKCFASAILPWQFATAWNILKCTLWNESFPLTILVWSPFWWLHHSVFHLRSTHKGFDSCIPSYLTLASSHYVSCFTCTIEQQIKESFKNQH